MPQAQSDSEPAAPGPPFPLARLYAAGVQCIATSLAFFLTVVVKLPVPLYFPLSRRWSLVPNSEELAMDFFGRSLLAIVVGVVAGGLTLLSFRVRARFIKQPPPLEQPETELPQTASAATPTSAPGSGLTLITVYAATAFVLAMGVFGYQLYGRAPVPEPLPPGLSTLQAAPSSLRPSRATPAPEGNRPAPASRAPQAADEADDP